MALTQANDMLKRGRPEAESVVIVLTDGKPLNDGMTAMAADELKKNARLIFVPVGWGIQKTLPKIRQWATQPYEDNVIEIKTFSEMSMPKYINTLIADACPQVER